MRVLVTGSRGYLGRRVVEHLVAAGHEVVPFAGDVRTAEVPPCDGIVHLAALVRIRESFDNPLDYYDVNVNGTLRLLRAGAPRFVLASTTGVYGTPIGPVLTEDHPRVPTNPYAATKAAAEDAVRWSARAGTVLRLFNLAGGGDRDDTRLITRACGAASGRLPALEVYGDGTAVRDFVHVRDAARAFVLALETAEPGRCEAYNVGATPASVAEVIDTAERVTGRPVPVVRRPAHPGETRELRADTTKLRSLGWAPRESSLEEIVADQWASER
ncbi:NAD-dependent epimerase/dehydratase family protein [Saccharothrix variisporea]|uniref:UDP-glucose 4-epimerase n=1 Tax=Saccharothrix variisporea TaxID=543527 RepID=A0A495XEU9_9PSEU|nr:NAD-dependent epimerase/dehydratase family protein [Saccharothrix variisporea]RKT71334.1 UDP-glucose 4-epimerase [Saccharothrix variisporea]